MRRDEKQGWWVGKSNRLDGQRTVTAVRAREPDSEAMRVTTWSGEVYRTVEETINGCEM